jgi:RNA polymerase sigma-70 factor (ECF subfamily)
LSSGSEPTQPYRATALLQKADSGELPPLGELVPLVYDELHEMAHWQLSREHRNVTLQTTALVNEAYLRLVDSTRVTRLGRAYFFAAAARAMRQVLVDAARRRGAAKRGSGAPLMSVDREGERVDAFASDLLDLDRALEDLGRHNPRHMQVVECRFFGGMSVEETAVALDVSERTIKADWALARAWLHQVLDSDEDE